MAQIAVEMTGDEKNLFRSVERAINQQKRLEDKFKAIENAAQRAERAGMRAGDELKRSGEKAGDAFGDKALVSLGKFTAGLVSLTTMLSTVKAGFDAVNEAANEAMQATLVNAPAKGQIAQLVSGPAEAQEIWQQAREVYIAGGAGSLTEAYNIAFQAKSSGAMSAVPLFRDLRKYNIIQEPPELMKASTILMGAFGEAQTGDYRDIINKAFAASKETQTNLTHIMLTTTELGAASKALRDANQRGISDVEALAAAAVASKVAKTPEVGATQIRSFLAGIQSPQEYDIPTGIIGPDFKEKMEKRAIPSFKGKSLVQIIRELSATNLTDEQMAQALGRREALYGYIALRDYFDEFTQVIAAERAAVQEDAIAMAMAINAADPELAAELRKRQASARLEVTRIPFGTLRSRSEALLQENVRRIYESTGGSPWRKSLASWWYEWNPFGERATRKVFGDTYYLSTAQPPPVPEGQYQGTWQEDAAIFYAARDRRMLREAGESMRANLAGGELRMAAEELHKAMRVMRSGPTLSHPDRDK